MMAETENTYKQSEPGPLMYVCALILGSGGAFVTATLWLDVSPGWVALAVGATFALLGAFMGETIVETIIFALILSVVMFVFIKLIPGLMVIKAGVVPGASGLSIGKLAVGIWKEIAT
jgi:hypothetical protein